MNPRNDDGLERPWALDDLIGAIFESSSQRFDGIGQVQVQEVTAISSMLYRYLMVSFNATTPDCLEFGCLQTNVVLCSSLRRNE